MKAIHAVWTFALVLAGACSTQSRGRGDTSTTQSPPRLDDSVKQRWRALGAEGAQLPEGRTLGQLALELATFTASNDPELRDRIGYEVSARWIGSGRLSDEELTALWRFHLEGLCAELGEAPPGADAEAGSDSVFRRSFSALQLSVLAARDNNSAFLGVEDYRSAIDGVTRLLHGERDRRGWVEGKGWAHAIAHAADLVKFLGRSRHLDAPAAIELFSALEAGFEGPNAWGENDRLAAAAASLLARDALDHERFTKRCAEWIQEADAVWQVEPFDTRRFRRSENRKQFLRALHVRMAMEPRPSSRQREIGKQVLQTLANMP